MFKEPEEIDGVLKGFPLHLGDVYLNGKSFYEAGRLLDVINPTKRFYGVYFYPAYVDELPAQNYGVAGAS